MSKSRKILSVALVAAMLASLVGCSGSSSSSSTPASSAPVSSSQGGEPTSSAAPAGLKAEEGANIEFAYWEGSTADKAAFDTMKDKFTKDHPELKVTWQTYPSNTYRDQLDTRIAGNDWPDVMRYTYQRLGKFKENGVMLDLTGKISEENLNDLVPAYRSALTYDGKLVGMPHHTDTIALFYNKKMFEESKIRIPKDKNDGWTWDELTEISKKLKADHKLDYAFGGIWENSSGYRYLPFVYMNGGSLLNDDQTKININTPEFKAATQMYADWRKDDLIVKTGFTQEPQTNMLFVANKIAFTFSGSWHCSYMEENMPGNWAVTYMPQVNGKSGSDLGGNGLFAYADTQFPEASSLFIDYMTTKENMKAFCEAGNFIPVRTSLIDEGLTFSQFQDSMDVFLDIVSIIDPKMAADETSTRFQQLNEIYSQAMDPIAIDGSVSVDDTIAKLESEMAEAIQ